MLRYIVFSVLVAAAVALSIRQNVHHCKTDSDCATKGCSGNDYYCSMGECWCHDNNNGKRAAETCKVDIDCKNHTCHHGAPHCEVHDPNGEHGHCNCHVPHKRAAETCKLDTDCKNHTCHHGAPHCEVHDPNGEHGHCNCHVPHKRAAETCKLDTDCKNHTCHHGAPHCEVHDPNGEHGHCNCHVPHKRANNHHCTQKSDCQNFGCAGDDYYCLNEKCACHDHNHGKRAAETCKLDTDCKNHTCHHGAPHCEVHDPNGEHGHCNCHVPHKRANNHHCTQKSDCQNFGCVGDDYYCLNEKCAYHDHNQGKRAAETCKLDTDCKNHTCHHGAPHCEVHDPNGEHGHCNCHVPHKRANNHHCTQKSDCQNFGCAGDDYYCLNEKCACHDHNHGKRAAETCKLDTDCKNHTCHHGAPHCEVHDPNGEHGHCNCHVPHKRANNHHCTQKSDCQNFGCAGDDYYCLNEKCACHDHNHGKRAAETCKVDTDCKNHTCHHGAPHCEVHDPNGEHGHCNCHVPHKRVAETCTTTADCADHYCNHGSPNCEIHDPNNAHGHCNCHTGGGK